MYVSCTLKLLSFHLQICLPQTNLLVCPTKFHFLGPRGPHVDYKAFDFPISFLPPATIFPSLLTKYFPFPNIFLLFLFHSSSPPHKIFSCPLETLLKRVRKHRKLWYGEIKVKIEIRRYWWIKEEISSGLDYVWISCLTILLEWRPPRCCGSSSLWMRMENNCECESWLSLLYKWLTDSE